MTPQRETVQEVACRTLGVEQTALLPHARPTCQQREAHSPALQSPPFHPTVSHLLTLSSNSPHRDTR